MEHFYLTPKKKNPSKIPKMQVWMFVAYVKEILFLLT